MVKLIAKPVVKNKYWIVENNGNKIGTVQAIDDGGGYVYVHNNDRKKYPSIKMLGQTLNIKFEIEDKSKPRAVGKQKFVLDGFPTDTKPHNSMKEVKHGVSVYTKTSKSKSFYCAGYFAIKENKEWYVEFCPKLITVNRHKILGPYMTKTEALEAAKSQE